ncbi:hypothetical protein FRB98_000644 [Tulasnella sp. 332]|nr:hypothetical protein FRB98_000644 [Tulasnella sp. 332]
MSDPLDPSALISKLPTLLPKDVQVLAKPQDGLAALLHTTMISLGFRLVALDDESPSQEIADGTLPEAWNKSSPDVYSFRYKHDQSSLVFFLKIVKLGTRVVIHGIALESGATNTLDILTSDYTSPSFFPHSLDSSSNPLVHGFISSNRVKDLAQLYKLNILMKLVPGLRKEGYEEATATAAPAPQRGQPSREQPRTDPSPFRPFGNDPRASNDYDPLRIPSIGRRDLDPIPRNPFSPPSLFGGEDDGMFVGPNHPIFRDRRGPGGAGSFGGEPQGPWGGDGFLPAMGAPPGARFDPIGPGPRGGLPLGGFPGPSRGGPFGSGQSGRGFMGEPDNDEFMPPGGDRVSKVKSVQEYSSTADLNDLRSRTLRNLGPQCPPDVQAQIQSRIAEIDARITELSSPAGVAGTFGQLSIQDPTYGQAGPSQPRSMSSVIPHSSPWSNGGGAGEPIFPPLPTPTPSEEGGSGSSPTSPFFSNIYKARVAAQPVVVYAHKHKSGRQVQPMPMEESTLREQQEAERQAEKRERKAQRDAQKAAMIPPAGRAAYFSGLSEKERNARILAFMNFKGDSEDEDEDEDVDVDQEYGDYEQLPDDDEGDPQSEGLMDVDGMDVDLQQIIRVDHGKLK